MAEQADVAFKDLDPEEQLFRMRHSAAHVMAEAVLEIFPDAKYAIGPPIDHGFYYDSNSRAPSRRTISSRSRSACDAR
ncbi:MAG TPA: hypothetical protein QF624_09805 [Dehalococcoidia bacterium]|nr:hypothetical protein [Dehalococcoidia bacterium]